MDVCGNQSVSEMDTLSDHGYFVFNTYIIGRLEPRKENEWHVNKLNQKLQVYWANYNRCKGPPKYPKKSYQCEIGGILLETKPFIDG